MLISIENSSALVSSFLLNTVRKSAIKAVYVSVYHNPMMSRDHREQI